MLSFITVQVPADTKSSFDLKFKENVRSIRPLDMRTNKLCYLPTGAECDVTAPPCVRVLFSCSLFTGCTFILFLPPHLPPGAVNPPDPGQMDRYRSMLTLKQPLNVRFTGKQNDSAGTPRRTSAGCDLTDVLQHLTILLREYLSCHISLC